MATASAPVKTNIIGLTKADYRGLESTLCNGCGHDSISARIIDACYDLGIRPEGLLKFSGIGCSSKSPAYFLSRSLAFNALHGRMPSVATGALVANHRLLSVGVSGDGDTGSIGIGQFSAPADVGQELKYAGRNELLPIDLCLEAIASGCGFVARSFAGDPKQVTTLLKAALSHRGTALLDIISPCVTFNNKDDSTKSYAWGKAHDERINDFTYIPPQEEITVDYAPGESREVILHDDSKIVLKKLDEKAHDPTDRMAAIRLLEEARDRQLFITGLIYVDTSRPNLAEHERLGDTPLTRLPEAKIRQIGRAHV